MNKKNKFFFVTPVLNIYLFSLYSTQYTLYIDMGYKLINNSRGFIFVFRR